MLSDRDLAALACDPTLRPTVLVGRRTLERPDADESRVAPSDVCAVLGGAVPALRAALAERWAVVLFDSQPPDPDASQACDDCGRRTTAFVAEGGRVLCRRCEGRRLKQGDPAVRRVRVAASRRSLYWRRKLRESWPHRKRRPRWECYGCEERWDASEEPRTCPYCQQPLVRRAQPRGEQR